MDGRLGDLRSISAGTLVADVACLYPLRQFPARQGGLRGIHCGHRERFRLEEFKMSCFRASNRVRSLVLPPSCVLATQQDTVFTSFNTSTNIWETHLTCVSLSQR